MTRHRPRKRFGQHFLVPDWADKVVEAIHPEPGDAFLEIGPGPGVLTTRLAARVSRLVAIEIDRDLSASLRALLPPTVEVVTADFLDVDLSPYLRDGSFRVAGNLPYNISSPILFKLLEIAGGPGVAAGPGGPGGSVLRLDAGARGDAGSADVPGPPAGSDAGRADLPGPPLIDATLMLQREVADRLVARTGTKDYGVLTILTAVRADVERLLTLPPGAFRPAPQVHSAVVRLRFRAPRVPAALDAAFTEMVRSVFTQRRKTLANALRPFADLRGRDPRAAISAAGLDPQVRPEALDVEAFVRLARVL